MTEQRASILEASPESLAEWLSGQGEPSYRAGQVLDWVFRKRTGSFDGMSNLPAALRERLAARYDAGLLRAAERLCSRDGRTEKLVLDLHDGERIESVLMRGGRGVTFCISSQAGCAMGCTFCATGAGGLARNLRTGEVLGQVLALARIADGMGNIVFMGMGEPLANLAAIVPALEALTDRQRFGLGERRITISTAGLPLGIRRLAEAPVHPNLALSLNSPFDEQRSELMPINQRYPLDEVLEACADYGGRTGRRLTLEYVLLGGVNTSDRASRAVAGLARRLHARVNLIAFNPVPGRTFHPCSADEAYRFRRTLEAGGVTVTQRYRRGRDIGAGCGQLSARRARGD